MQVCRRAGFTVIEVFVVCAILAVLLALLLPAIQRVREIALKTESTNNLRQLIFATLQSLPDNQNIFPDVTGAPNDSPQRTSVHIYILPYLEQGGIYTEYISKQSGSMSNEFAIKLFYSPSDQTIAQSNNPGHTSYPLNGCLFVGDVSIDSGVLDGTSNTIAFAEHYGFGCGSVAYAWNVNSLSYISFPPQTNGGIVISKIRRATFADPFLDDIIPQNILPGLPAPSGTFQTRPKLADCDPRLAQTPHASGMLVALADGSVRTLAPDMKPETYWAAVTPAGNEPLGGDW
jgi:type II secretory pathway pseudopilin PulG